jgi:hypothetical protein
MNDDKVPFGKDVLVLLIVILLVGKVREVLLI